MECVWNSALKERSKDLEQLQVEREPVEYKQNDKSCAYPLTALKCMSS